MRRVVVIENWLDGTCVSYRVDGLGALTKDDNGFFEKKVVLLTNEQTGCKVDWEEGTEKMSRIL